MIETAGRGVSGDVNVAMGFVARLVLLLSKYFMVGIERAFHADPSAVLD